jgi:hypothetical protein
MIKGIKIYQFIFNLLYDLSKSILGYTLIILVLFWVAGWIMIAPAWFIYGYINNEINFTVMILGLLFYIVPASIWATNCIYEKWQKFNKDYKVKYDIHK